MNIAMDLLLIFTTYNPLLRHAIKYLLLRIIGSLFETTHSKGVTKIFEWVVEKKKKKKMEMTKCVRLKKSIESSWMAQTMKQNSPIGSTLGSIAFISVGVITAIFLYDLWVGGIDDAADDASGGGGNEVGGGASQAHDYCINGWCCCVVVVVVVVVDDDDDDDDDDDE
jgi:hypothetical protein